MFAHIMDHHEDQWPSQSQQSDHLLLYLEVLSLGMGRLPPLNSGVVSTAIVDLLILSICTLSVFSYFFLC